MEMKKRFVLVIIFFAVFALFIFSNDEILRGIQLPLLSTSADFDVSCYGEPSTKDSFPRFDVLKERIRLSSGRNIFFHETSCFGDSEQAELNCRQACAVESAARANPATSVNVLFLSPSPPSNRTRRLADLLLRYDNVRLHRVRVAEYVKDTPIEQWFNSGVLGTSRWPRSHMSDVMRYLTLWKFGGVYLDLDVVVTASLEDITNFAGAEDWMDVAAGVIGFSATGLGRRVANACLRDLMRNFNGNVWGNNGPGVITRTLQKFCNVKHAKDMTPWRCNGFTVYPPPVFYPIFYRDWRLYFNSDNLNETMSKLKDARAIHVWNKLSSSEIIEVGSRVPYALIAQKHCPVIYNNCGVTF